jgi:hypothetical protein
MTVGICFKSEQRGWMQDQWSWVFSNYGITDIWERNCISEDAKIYQPVIHITNCTELPDRPLVVLSPIDAKYMAGTESLLDFDHPEDAIYVFGGSYDNLSLEEDFGGRIPDHIVYIPTVKYECYSHSAAYQVLWDRYVKRGSHG